METLLLGSLFIVVTFCFLFWRHKKTKTIVAPEKKLKIIIHQDDSTYQLEVNTSLSTVNICLPSSKQQPELTGKINSNQPITLSPKK